MQCGGKRKVDYTSSASGVHNVAPVENLSELGQVDIFLLLVLLLFLLVRLQQALFDAQLYEQRLWKMTMRQSSSATRRRTSVLEKRSLSTNSATPISRFEASAKATPTILVSPLPDSLTAMTIGAVDMSSLTNSRSSTSCRLPGDALDEDGEGKAR